MVNIIILVLTLSWYSAIFAADTTTLNLGLTKPEEGSTSWGPKINADLDLIDTKFGTLGSAAYTSSTAYQTSDPTLSALAAHNTNGILTQTAPDTFAGRTITGTANVVTVTNGNGVSGNPTLTLPAAIINGSVMYAADSGSTNALAITLAVAPASYQPGVIYRVMAANTVTGATTINVNGLGVKNVRKMGSGGLVDLVAGDINGGEGIELFDDGTLMQLTGRAGNSSAATPSFQSVATVGSTYTGADSFSHALKAGVTSEGIASYDHATFGPQHTPFCAGVENGCDKFIKLNSGFTFGIKDSNNAVIASITEAGAVSGFGGSDYRVEVTNTGTQSIPDSVVTAVAWAAETYDTDSMHDNVTTNSHIKFTHAGTYMIGGSVVFAGNATGDRIVEVKANGSTILYTRVGPATAMGSAAGVNESFMPFTTLFQAAANDYVEVYVYQSSTGSLNLQASSVFTDARFYAKKLN